jgi:large subunit ribosomal protein L4
MASSAKIYNIQGEKVGDIDLPAFFDETPNETVLSQYVRVYLANQRQGTRKTKDRSEVTGRAGKPYKQKGTGRARHGSMKAPSMRKGGVAHGPRPQNFSLKMPKVMKSKALLFSYAKKKDDCIILDSAKLDIIKTRKIQDFLDKTNLNDSVLFVVSGKDENFFKSTKNVPNVIVANVSNLNAYNILSSKNIVIEKNVLESMLEAKPKKSIKKEAISKSKSKKS